MRLLKRNERESGKTKQKIPCKEVKIQLDSREEQKVYRAKLQTIMKNKNVKKSI